MLELKALRENPAAVAEALAKKNVADPLAAVSSILELDEQRRKLITLIEGKKGQMNRLAKFIGKETERDHRLSKVMKEFNLGNDTIVAFLKGKGHAASSDIATSKLTAEQYELLFESYADGKKLKEHEELKKIANRNLSADDRKAESIALKADIAKDEAEVSILGKYLDEALVVLPNLPHPSVPSGKTADDNTVVREHGSVPALGSWKQPHWDLAAKNGLIDFEAGVKITGAGFPVYRGQGARLQRALINFFLDQAAAAGYTEIQPPVVVNRDSAYGTGQLPDKDGQMYYVGADELYLIPTAEVPITNLYRDVIIEPAQLPVRMAGYTPCFRREAGSYGAHVRGLNRLHQFDKVELVQIAEPAESYTVLEQMLAHVEKLLQLLELPYRVLLLCGGDMSFASAKTYDLEVWSAGQDRWLEVSSVSNFETFQSNRLKCRIRNADGKGTHLAHTLNGSALALPRIVAGLLEAHQQPDGTVSIPAALRSYTGFDRIG
jgi:seryl-tRNA synthetase